jgi:hypothetical protein
MADLPLASPALAKKLWRRANRATRATSFQSQCVQEVAIWPFPFCHRDGSAAVLAFLKGVLGDGAVAVADLEVRALAAGLLSDRQKITDAKAFKTAKKALGIKSHRVGFGPGAVWFWALPTKPETKVIETAAGLASNTPAPVVYAEHHSRPERGDVLLDLGPGPDDGLGGVPAEWVRGVKLLHLARGLRGVPTHRWQQFVSDCQHFVFSHEKWAVRAAQIGWTTESLFGCSWSRPFDHLGSAGLLWHLVGGRLVRLHRDWAVIAAADGAERVFHRRPTTMRCTLAWRLR